MSAEYRYGTPSFEEWDQLWKDTEGDSDVNDQEFHAAYQALDLFISRYGKVGFSTDSDFYVLGDSYGDKTQDIEIVNPHAITIEFLNSLQGWIGNFFPAWRIVIPVFIAPKAAIIVYRDTIRFPEGYEVEPVSGLRTIRERMLDLDEYKHLRR